MNTLSCAAFSISTLETDKILIKGVTKSADNGTIALDNVKLFPNTGSFCNALEACTREVTITTTPKPEVTTSGSASTFTPPTQPKDKFNKMLILGIAVGCFFLVILVVVFAWFSWYRSGDLQGKQHRVSGNFQGFSKRDSRSHLTTTEEIQVYIEQHPDYDIEICPDYD